MACCARPIRHGISTVAHCDSGHPAAAAVLLKVFMNTSGSSSFVGHGKYHMLLGAAWFTLYGVRLAWAFTGACCPTPLDLLGCSCLCSFSLSISWSVGRRGVWSLRALNSWAAHTSSLCWLGNGRWEGAWPQSSWWYDAIGFMPALGLRDSKFSVNVMKSLHPTQTTSVYNRLRTSALLYSIYIGWKYIGCWIQSLLNVSNSWVLPHF